MAIMMSSRFKSFNGLRSLSLSGLDTTGQPGQLFGQAWVMLACSPCVLQASQLSSHVQFSSPALPLLGLTAAISPGLNPSVLGISPVLVSLKIVITNEDDNLHHKRI